MKRTPLKRRTPLRPVSKKRAKQNGEYSKLKRQLIKDFSICEICWSTRAVDVHHRHGREGLRLLDIHDWIFVCRDCHRMIHDHPQAARDAGLLV
jgi:HNH endonuclease